MAVCTGGRSQVVIVADVTCGARGGGMRSRQGESGFRVIERGTGPIGGRMAQRTVGGEPSRFVVRVGC